MRCRACSRPLAGAAAAAWLVSRGRAFFRCPRCGHVRLDPTLFPDPAAAGARYRLHRNDPADPGYRRFLEAFAEAAVLPFAAPGARVLDFGSGPEPALASLLAGRGYGAACWDPVFAPGRAPLRARYALVALHEVLEHVASPARTLRFASSLLEPGGVLAIRTRFPPSEPEAFASWWYKEDPTHVGFFGPDAFRALAARIGAEPVLLRAPDLAALRFPGVTGPGRIPARAGGRKAAP